MSKKLRMGMVAATAALCVALASSWSYAQQPDREPRGGDRGADRGGDRGARGPGGNFDPAEFRERMVEGLKTRLEVGDDEWTVIGPLFSKLLEAQNAARPYSTAGGGRGGFFGFGGPGAPGGDRGPGGPGGDRGPGGPGGTTGRSDAPERDALQATLTSGGDVEGKLKAYREARDKKNAELKKAQDDLRAVLTVKQEAFCVLMGLLE